MQRKTWVSGCSTHGILTSLTRVPRSCHTACGTRNVWLSHVVFTGIVRTGDRPNLSRMGLTKSQTPVPATRRAGARIDNATSRRRDLASVASLSGRGIYLARKTCSCRWCKLRSSVSRRGLCSTAAATARSAPSHATYPRWTSTYFAREAEGRAGCAITRGRSRRNQQIERPTAGRDTRVYRLKLTTRRSSTIFISHEHLPARDSYLLSIPSVWIIVFIRTSSRCLFRERKPFRDKNVSFGFELNFVSNLKATYMRIGFFLSEKILENYLES